jgi:nicotinamidase-related amidase
MSAVCRLKLLNLTRFLFDRHCERSAAECGNLFHDFITFFLVKTIHPYGGKSWQIPAELSPRENDIRIYKLYNSAFEETTLEKTLAQLGISHIALAGAATNWCIRATAYAALERGYDLTLIDDAHTTRSIERQNGGKIAAADIVDELNVVMEWVSHPGRSNCSVLSVDLDFALASADE